LGKGLGKTTGWGHRLSLKKDGVHMLSGVTYKEVNEEGLVIVQKGEEQTLKVDHVVICSGQTSQRTLLPALKESGIPIHVIGGADEAKELDAKSAIKQGSELAFKI
jgi:2,4-dienoyl-CoA reductase (NADPH2)